MSLSKEQFYRTLEKLRQLDEMVTEIKLKIEGEDQINSDPDGESEQTLPRDFFSKAFW